MFDELTSAVQKVLRSQYDLDDVDIAWKRPQEASHGDISCVLALQLAKTLKKKPRDVADCILSGLQGQPDIEKVEVAGPGYVNVWLTSQALLRELEHTRTACTAKVTRKAEAPVIVEYSQPNIAKPLGVHHLLSTNVGQAISNLYRHLGYPTISINHLGDWGTQFGKLAVAVERWSDKPVAECSLDELLQLYVRFHDETENDPSLEDEGRAAFLRLEKSDPEIRAFWASVIEITMKELGILYERLHVSFDHTHGESFYEDKMQSVIEEGKKKDVFVEGNEGALVVHFPEETNLPPAIVVKGDGATIYLTRDLATIRYRVDTWHPQSVLYVVDVAQQLYFEQLFATVEQLGWDLPNLEHVIIGRMSFKDRSMSTRKGSVLKLREVLDEAVRRADALIKDRGDAIQTDDPEDLAEMMGVGAVVYGILSQNRRMDMIFDWEKMLSFDGNSAPYLQYTHARTQSVLRKAVGDGASMTAEPAAVLVEKERELIGILLQFADVLEEARSAHMPHILANYLFDLCQTYNAFYNAEPILKADEPARTLRLALTALTASVLRTGTGILTIRVPDRM